MGLDFATVFQKSINFEDRNDTEFTPFSRACSNFFYSNYYGEDSTLEEVEISLNVGLKYLIEPNLHDFTIDEMQLEFTEGEMREKLLAKQNKFDQNSHKAWKDISNYLKNLKATIKVLSESIELSELQLNNSNWSKYIQSGEFVEDLKKIKQLLNEAKENGIDNFTFQLY